MRDGPIATGRDEQHPVWNPGDLKRSASWRWVFQCRSKTTPFKHKTVAINNTYLWGLFYSLWAGVSFQFHTDPNVLYLKTYQEKSKKSQWFRLIFLSFWVYHAYHFQTQPGHGISAQELRGARVEGKLGASRAKGAGVSVYQAWNIPDFPGYTPPFTRDLPASHVSKLGREFVWLLCRTF